MTTLLVPPKLLVTLLLALAGTLLLLTTAADAASVQTVNLVLQDSSVDPAISGMAIKSDAAKVRAGRVTFAAVNRSKNLVHEVIVMPALPEGKIAPYDAKADKVVESRVQALGEISDLKPGARGKLTLTLKPGTYVLFCNEPGHYKAGMTTTLVVEK
jgi:uncharacterized cupredoxin-like copper-binding protein